MKTRVAPLMLWSLLDARRGHRNQVLGLREALARHRPVHSSEIELPRGGGWRAIVNILGGGAHRALPDPDLIIGAGHATHVPMLLMRRLRGGRSICLMNPSLPRWCFDLCIVPSHDDVAESPRVLVTEGALNRVRPAHPKRPASGIVLIGGPSRHLRWDDARIVERIAAILEQGRGRRWTLAPSPRTPVRVLDALESLTSPTVALVRYETTAADWLPDTLASVEVAWVTEDSVSMVYEALSAGAAVGVVDVDRDAGRRPDRIAAGVDDLVARGLATRSSGSREPEAPATPLAEADRCAAWILEQWFPVDA